MFGLVSLAWIVGAWQLWDTMINFTTQWYWLIAATVYTLTINDIFQHQILSHTPRKIRTESWVYKVLIFLAVTETSFGRPSQFCLLHRHHHERPDHQDDILLPRRSWWLYNILAPWIWLRRDRLRLHDQDRYLAQQRSRYHDMLHDPWTQFCERNQALVTCVFWLFLYVAAPILLFKVLLMGRLLMSIFMGLSSNLGHLSLPTGYKNSNTGEEDRTHNYLILHYLALGLSCGMLHNNHHNVRPGKSLTVRWFELDVASLIRRPLQHLILHPAK